MNDDIKLAEETLGRLRKCCQSLQEQMSSVLIGQDEATTDSRGPERPNHVRGCEGP